MRRVTEGKGDITHESRARVNVVSLEGTRLATRERDRAPMARERIRAGRHVEALEHKGRSVNSLYYIVLNQHIAHVAFKVYAVVFCAAAS